VYLINFISKSVRTGLNPNLCLNPVKYNDFKILSDHFNSEKESTNCKLTLNVSGPAVKYVATFKVFTFA
jgi:hypothetical protein